MLFVGVKFSLMNILFEFERPIEDLSMLVKSLLVRRAFFAYFRLMKRIIVFFELFFDSPSRWQASISSVVTLTSIFFSISITFSSSFLCSTLSGTPVISRSFRGRYCYSKFPFSSREKLSSPGYLFCCVMVDSQFVSLLF